jgi:hypothetical protein
LVQSAAPPLAAVGIAALLGASDDEALLWGIWTCVAFLAVWGAATARSDRSSWVTVVIAGAGCASLGLLLIFLKTLVG